MNTISYSVFNEVIWKRQVDRWFILIGLCLAWFIFKSDMGNKPMSLLTTIDLFIQPFVVVLWLSVFSLWIVACFVHLFTKKFSSLPWVWMVDLKDAFVHVIAFLLYTFCQSPYFTKTIHTLPPSGYVVLDAGSKMQFNTQICICHNGSITHRFLVYEVNSLLDIILNEFNKP